MIQYKKYLEDNYTKATIEAYFKGITIFNNFLRDREINRILAAAKEKKTLERALILFLYCNEFSCELS